MEREMKAVLHGNADVTELRQEEQSIFLSALYMRMLDLVGKQRTEQEALVFRPLELKRNRRRSQGEQFVTENAKRKNGNATNFSFSLDLFGRFRFGRSCRKTNFKNQKEIST